MSTLIQIYMEFVPVRNPTEWPAIVMEQLQSVSAGQELTILTTTLTNSNNAFVAPSIAYAIRKVANGAMDLQIESKCSTCVLVCLLIGKSWVSVSVTPPIFYSSVCAHV